MFASDSYLVFLPIVSDDSKSPNEADIVWRLFIPILFR